MVNEYVGSTGLKSTKVNRLFLIGNGFDLAVGLKTKYSDFLFWLFKKEIVKAIDSRIYQAPIEKYNDGYDTIHRENRILNVNGYSENSLFDVVLRKKGSTRRYEEIYQVKNLKELYDFLIWSETQIKPAYNELLLYNLMSTSKNNWVDIENIYFKLLKNIVLKNKSNASYDLVDELNEELSIVTEYLKEYLKSIDISVSNEDANKYFQQFISIPKATDFLGLNAKKTNIKVTENYFLNFNYTNSITAIISHFEQDKFYQNHIHNNLDDEELIFGFGDEMDSIYKEIEELNDNRFFKHIKSFHYFKTSKLRDLQRFLNSGDYQVCVYGHSCGLSDRVMLNEIFEHENCKSIKIYYYNDEDFTTKTMEISRHFNSNQMMRKKIVEKSEDCLIPQIVKK